MDTVLLPRTAKLPEPILAGTAPPRLRGLCRTTRVSFAALAATLVTSNALAAAAPPPNQPDSVQNAEAQTSSILTLKEAVTAGLTAGFDVRLAQLAVDAAQGDARSFAAVANPAVSAGAGRALGYHPSSCDPGSSCSPNQYTVGLSDQAAINDILSGKRGLRKVVGRHAVRVASLQRDDAVRLIRQRIKQQFASVAFSQARARLADRVLARAQETERLVKARYNSGGPLADLLRAQAVLLDARQRIRGAQAQLTADRAQLSVLMGRQHLGASMVDESLLEQAPSQVDAAANQARWVEQAKSTRPDRMAADAAVDQSEAALSLARRNRWPDIELQLGYTQQGLGNNAIQPGTISFGLSAPLPIVYQNQGQIERAIADEAARNTERQRLDLQIDSTVRTSLSSTSAAWAQAQYAEQRLAHARQAVDLVQLQYQEGATSLVDLLEATSSAIDAEDNYLDARQAYWTRLFQLEYDSGKELLK